jgi:hypothetical protein
MPTQPDGNHLPVEQLFDELLALSRDAHAGRHHEVAYHALIAALHAAQDANDHAGMRVIVDEARAQIDWIDRHDPAQRLSTTSAAGRNHPGVYAMLGRQAQTMADMIDVRK